MKIISLISLGCPKNLVDSETVLGVLTGAGYIVTPEPEAAEIILINTCGFIKPAVDEAIAAILKYLELKKQGSCSAVIVFGCLVSRYGEKKLSQLLPEVDGWLGVDAAPHILSYLEKILAGEKQPFPLKKQECDYPRLLATPPYTAYIKIAEGCSHGCSFCLIPSIRGPLHSRKPEAIYNEAVQLASGGVKEIILVAQDTGVYGRDLPGKPTLAGLLKRLCRINGLHWIRFLYLNPHNLTPELVKTMQDEPKLCRYLDLPFQHANREILKKMGRKGDSIAYLQLLNRLRASLPGITLRTTLMVGFPGEGKREFYELKDFVSQARFDRLGVFPYYHEEGARSGRYTETVSYFEKRRRVREIMALQRHISRSKNQEQVGRNLEVLIEQNLGDGVYYGRSYQDVPEIDPRVIVRGQDLSSGDIVKVLITSAATYDLIGVV
jgi:ribosomal protein S12 methylthiotransferase